MLGKAGTCAEVVQHELVAPDGVEPAGEGACVALGQRIPHGLVAQVVVHDADARLAAPCKCPRTYDFWQERASLWQAKATSSESPGGGIQPVPGYSKAHAAM